MNIFVTGATGFIGKEVLKKLSNSKHLITCLSRNSSSNINLNTHFIAGDLNKIESYSQALVQSNPQCAILLAWEGLPDYGPEACIKNVTAQLNLINQLIISGCKKIILAGSCWQYGNQLGQVTEDTPAVSPGLFAESKNSIFKLATKMARERDVSIIDARIFFVFGKGQRSTSLIPSVISAIKNGKQPNILNPEAGNDFIHISDVANALKKLVESNVETGIFNLGSGRSTQVKEVINTICELNKTPYIFDVDYIQSGFWSDIKKMKEIGWEPAISIREGIKSLL